MSSRYWQRNFVGLIFFIAFLSTIPIANYATTNLGSLCVSGACLVPVWPYPKVYAVSSVLVVGVNFVLRDLVQRSVGIGYAFVAVILGSLLSYAVSSSAVATASALTFLISETVNTMVYTPLQRKNFILAIMLAGIAGVVVDSVIFLWLAFGSLEFLLGSIIGKLWAILLCIPLVGVLRKRVKF